jgi:hypothetical protein
MMPLPQLRASPRRVCGSRRFDSESAPHSGPHCSRVTRRVWRARRDSETPGPCRPGSLLQWHWHRPRPGQPVPQPQPQAQWSPSHILEPGATFVRPPGPGAWARRQGGAGPGDTHAPAPPGPRPRPHSRRGGALTGRLARAEGRLGFSDDPASNLKSPLSVQQHDPGPGAIAGRMGLDSRRRAQASHAQDH